MPKTTKELTRVQRTLMLRASEEADAEFARIRGEYLQVLFMVAEDAGVSADGQAQVTFNAADGVLEIHEPDPEPEPTEAE